MPAAQTAHEWRATADEIWDVLKETDRIIKETAIRQAETDRIVKETQKENAKGFAELRESQKEGFAELKESQKEIAMRMKETDKRIGELGHRFGEMVEHMVLPNLLSKFNKLRLPFTKAGPNIEIADKQHGIYAEVDAFLENGENALIVEIKSKPNINDINDHVERMEKLRKYADLHNDKRKYLGAVAGVVFGENEKNYALKKGFYVIEPSGETFKITEPAGSPREW
jgi:hypothetical protein